MRRVLVLGGTGWLGREVARAARDDGAEVVCLARGQSGTAPEGVTLERADRTQSGAYDGLSGEWDEVIELAYEPALVASALEALADRAAHWTLVSTVSVYADDGTPGADEAAELVDPKDLTSYPDAKVHAEQVTSSRLGGRLLVARPGLIVGPGDPSDRFGYWPARLYRGGRVLTRTLQGRFVQVIDVADLARWLVSSGAKQIVGTFNAVGLPHTMEEFFTAACAATGFDGELVAVNDEALLINDVQYWAGPRSLPLWLPPEAAGLARRDTNAFLAAGGHTRPLAETLDRALAYEIERGVNRERRSGLTPDEERQVLLAAG